MAARVFAPPRQVTTPWALARADRIGMGTVFLPNPLAGQAAFVTGGGSGIGAGIAKMLSRQGARVALLGRTQSKLDEVAAAIRSAGGEARGFAADVRDYAAVEAAR